MATDLRKRYIPGLTAGTLSAICTCARAPVPPIPRTAMYRPVQLPKTAGRSTSGRPGSLRRETTPASTTGPDSRMLGMPRLSTRTTSACTCRLPVCTLHLLLVDSRRQAAPQPAPLGASTTDRSRSAGERHTTQRAVQRASRSASRSRDGQLGEGADFTGGGVADAGVDALGYGVAEGGESSHAVRGRR
jgi:hypothetical protein